MVVNAQCSLERNLTSVTCALQLYQILRLSNGEKFIHEVTQGN